MSEWIATVYLLGVVVGWVVFNALFEPDPIWDPDDRMDRAMERLLAGLVSALAVWLWPLIVVTWTIRWWLRHTDVAGLWSRTHPRKTEQREKVWRL